QTNKMDWSRVLGKDVFSTISKFGDERTESNLRSASRLLRSIPPRDYSTELSGYSGCVIYEHIKNSPNLAAEIIKRDYVGYPSLIKQGVVALLLYFYRTNVIESLIATLDDDEYNKLLRIMIIQSYNVDIRHVEFLNDLYQEIDSL